MLVGDNFALAKFLRLRIFSFELMEDKSQFIGILLVVCALILLFNIEKDQKTAGPAVAQTIASESQGDVLKMHGNAGGSETAAGFETGAEAGVDEEILTIGNDAIDVLISNVTGAIRSTALKKYMAFQNKPDPVIFNDGSPIDALALTFSAKGLSTASSVGKFDVTSLDKTSIKLVKTLANGCKIVREYSVSEADDKIADGHVVIVKVSVENCGTTPLNVGDMSLCLGTMPPTESDNIGEHINFGGFNGEKGNFTSLRDFKARRGFFGIGKRDGRNEIFSSEKILWGAVKNQFFTAILTPDGQADGYVSWPVTLRNRYSNEIESGIAGSMTFIAGILEAGEQKSLLCDFYVGPKDFSMLSTFDMEQDRVVQFGFFGAISELLLRLMLKIHSVIPNWGWTIIALTTIVKLFLWPLTNAQVQSSKKMEIIREPLKIINEKFKKNPQKLQAETVKLFKEHQVNPAAGCLLLFIQIPIFLGLYCMLRASSDLRFAHFLWIKDLSLPDTVARVGGFPINILPLIMGAVTILQMRMTPMPTASDSQKLMMRGMMGVFLICCYNFPSGVVLYWTVQNLLTIGQQFATSRMSGAGLEAASDAEVPGAAGYDKAVGHGKKRTSITKKRKR
jgi:YidC/Oxa1 family membrane protein insertase